MFLTPKQRLVLRMRRLDGLAQKDIARQLRMSEAAVSRLLTRARERVAGLMQQCGGAGSCELEALIN